MATFKLGAIITQIAGSVGGTTFRRNGFNNVMSNKNAGSSYARLLGNPALSYLGPIFKKFQYLSEEEREAWRVASRNFQFPDKFGTLRYLTPRQFFIKLTSQLWIADQYPIPPTMINSVLPNFSISSVVWYGMSNQVLIDLDFAPPEYYYILQLEYTQNYLNAPTFTSRKFFHYIEEYDDEQVNILPQILEN